MTAKALPERDLGYRRDPRDLRSPPEKLDDAAIEAGLAHVRRQFVPVLRRLREAANELGCLQTRVVHQEEAVRRLEGERDFLRYREEDLLLEQDRRSEENNA